MSDVRGRAELVTIAAMDRPATRPATPVRRVALLTLLASFAAACHVTGPRSIKTGRDNYNVAIQQTNNEQLLLNLVRLRYRDTPLFLEIASVTSNFSFDVGGGSATVTVAPASGRRPSGPSADPVPGGPDRARPPTRDPDRPRAFSPSCGTPREPADTP